MRCSSPGKTGVIDHEAAESVKARIVVPLTPLPVTAKAYAAFRRADIVYVPDFIALAAPLLAAFDPTAATDPVERVRELMQHIAAEGPNAWLVAIGLAEAFLSTWQDTLPFGRPSPWPMSVPEQLSEQLGAEQFEDLIERVAGWRAGLVLRSSVSTEWAPGAVAVRVALRRVDLDADEPITEFFTQPFESLWRGRPCRR